MIQPRKWGTHVELLAAATYFQVPVYILKATSMKWEVLHPLGPARNYAFQEFPATDTCGEEVNIPDHFELLHSSDCHYDSITSISGSSCSVRPTIIQTHIDCTKLLID